MLLASALLLPGAVNGQQHAFRQFTPTDGLAQSQVRCMAQDAEGYLWMGTLGGASRFDGHTFTNYALREGLPDAQVNAMLARKDGTFWLGAGSAVVLFDGRSMRSMPLPSGANGARVQSLVELDGDLLIATDGAGIYRMHGRGMEPLRGFPNDSVRTVRVLLATSDGGLLIGARNGCYRWKNGVCSLLGLGARLPSISALAVDADGSIWVGTYGDGAYRVRKDGRIDAFDDTNGLSQNNIRALQLDERGRVWIGTKFGLNMWDGQRWRAFTVHQGMPNDNVNCLFLDSENGLWIGTDGAGVMRYAGDRFVTWTVTEGLCSDLVMTIVNDAHGDLWLGTYGNGVCRKDGMALISTLDGLLNNTVWCAMVDADSSLWFGTSDGLCHVAHGVIVPLDTSQALLGERVLALHRDADGTRWCGSRDGLTIIRTDGSLKRIKSVGGSPVRTVRSVLEAKDGAHWLATDNGVLRMRGDSCDRWTMKEGLCDNTVFCLAQDAQERIWIGTSNGLSCYDGARFINTRLGPDFGSNYVDLLIMDKRGLFWAGTNNGIFRWAPDNLLRDSSDTEHFSTADGIRGTECNLNAGFVDEKGRVFIGTNAGLVMHDPSREPKEADPTPAQTHIIGLRSFLQPTDWKGQCDSIASKSGLPVGLRLPYRRNHITFDYTAVALDEGDRVRFQYRLLGADPGWLPASNARFASYSNLTLGEYEFQVRSVDRHGVAGPVASFHFTITPPFWLRWWFFALALLGLGAMAYGIMRFRAVRRARAEKTRQLMLRSRMLQLEQQALNANMNRHFIFNALNSIQYYINRQDRAVANRYLTSFAKLIRKNLDASQSDTTTLAEELERLELYLTLEHMRFKDKFRYTLTVAPQVDTQAVDIPAMMLQPYVENSIWHGILPMERQGVVDIRVAPTLDGHVRVTISDDGIGVDQSRASKNGSSDHISRGIEITKGRADVLRRLSLADIRITGPEELRTPSGEPSGTQVTIDLPSKNNAVRDPRYLESAGDHITFD